jgi:hypothetical protein
MNAEAGPSNPPSSTFLMLQKLSKMEKVSFGESVGSKN